MPVVVALAAHGIGLGGAFVADDARDIIQHPVVNGAAPLHHLLRYTYMGDPLGEGANTLRPLATLLFALEWRLWGEAPAPFHAVSIGLFVALVVLCQVLFRKFLARRDAMLAAAVFASLAIHVDAVGLVANSADTLAALLCVLCLLAALGGRAALACGLYALALLSKESAIAWPAVVALAVAALEGPRALAARRRWALLAALVAIGAAFVAWRASLLPLDVSRAVLRPDNMLVGAPLAVRAWMPFVLLGRYLATTLVPTSLSFDYTYDAIPVELDLLDVHGWIGAAFVAALGACGWWWWRGRGERTAARGALLLGAGGFLACYAVVSNSVFLIVTLMAERLFLVPSLWLVVLGAAVVRRLNLVEPRAARLLGALAVVLVATQAPLAAARTWECRDELALFSAQVASQPDSVKGHSWYALTLSRRGRHAEALWHLAVAAGGRTAFPRRWRAPSSRLTSSPRALERLPELAAPNIPPEVFWPAFRRLASRLTGPDTVALLDRVHPPGEPPGE